MRNEFRYRLNKLYVHPLLGDLLDSGDIDYAILDALEQFSIRDHLILHINDYHSIQEFMKYPIVKALLDNNIVYKSKYYNEMHIEHMLYKDVLRDYVR